MKPLYILSLAIFIASWVAITVGAQGGGNILYGDVKVDEDGADGSRAITFQLILYNLSGNIVARQTVGSNGRYRFNDLGDGEYDLVVEQENSEIARIRVQLRSPVHKTDHRQDITLAWKSENRRPSKPVAISAEETYERSRVNQQRFEKAEHAADKKKYDEAGTLLKEIVAEDPKDFQAWTALGTAYLATEELDEAGKAYRSAIEVKPRFFQALLNLGRLHLLQKDYENAVSVLSTAVEVRATSPEANYYLGEAYLQAKKGSKAVVYFNEALRLDPVGKAEAHLRLAILYSAVGMKGKAALEYEQFLKKKPDYPNRKKLEQFINSNKTEIKKN
jgi:tetratricopeptide (TPR) repeat protein